MIIGLAGSFGAGKGEKRIPGASQEVASYFVKNSNNLNSVGTTPVPALLQSCTNLFGL
jgi:hypothetical protein